MCVGGVMPLLRVPAEGLQVSAVEQQLAGLLAEHFGHQVGYLPGAGEVRSWERSLPVLARDLVDAGLSQVEVLVEYRLPLSSKRIDAVLAGVHPKTGRASYVVVELKQWSHARPWPDANDLVQIDAYGGRPVLHPVEQVRRYAVFLTDFTRALAHEPDAVVGVAYLHNARDGDVAGLELLPQTALGQLFTASSRGRWLEFLRSRLAPASGAVAADLLLSSRIAPSRQLLDVAAEEISQREQFTLLDEQQVAYSLVLSAVRRAQQSDRKTVVVVTGGPGSGKSVIALSLLGELTRRGHAAMHATGSSAFTKTMRRVAGYRNTRVQSLFKYFNSFMAAERNSLDVLICDEAHRIRATSANRYTRAEHRTGRLQAEELMAVARVPVFLLDEHQVVRPGEVGRVDDIVQTARRLSLDLEMVSLDGQFRSGGSRVYEEWVLRLLGLADGGPMRWEGDERFALLVADSPEEMEAMLADRLAEGYGARMTAGYCWRWSDPKGGRLVPDVRVGDWARPWNNKSDRTVDGAPPTSLWATQDGGFGQVGCVYTAQGFEYDWNGVLLGPDLVWRGDRFVGVPTASKDPAYRGAGPAEFDTYVRNIYKVLLTRGMVGTILTSTDAETCDLLHELVDEFTV